MRKNKFLLLALTSLFVFSVELKDPNGPVSHSPTASISAHEDKRYNSGDDFPHESLSLKGLDLKQGDIQALLPLIEKGCYSHIISLDFKGIPLTSYIVDIIFNHCPNLNSVNLEGCGLTELPSSIRLLKNLKNLDLIGNPITVLPKEVMTLPNLHEIFVPDTIKEQSENPNYVGSGELAQKEKLNIHYQLNQLSSDEIAQFASKYVVDFNKKDWKEKKFWGHFIKGMTDSLGFVGSEVKNIVTSQAMEKELFDHLTKSIAEYRGRFKTIANKLRTAEKYNPKVYKAFIQNVIRQSKDREFNTEKGALSIKESLDLVNITPDIILKNHGMSFQDYKTFLKDINSLYYNFISEKAKKKYGVLDSDFKKVSGMGKIKAWVSSFNYGWFFNRNLRKNAERLKNKLAEYRNFDMFKRLTNRDKLELFKDYNHAFASLDVLNKIFRKEKQYDWVETAKDSLVSEWDEVLKNFDE